MASPEKPTIPLTEEKKVPPVLNEAEIRAQVGESVPPKWLDIYFRENPHMKAQADQPIEGFEDKRREETRVAIEQENTRRRLEGKEPLTLVGVHAAPRGESLSRLMLDKITESAEGVGLERKLVSIATEDGKVDEAAIQEAVEKIRKADGFIITTQTREGRFNKFTTALFDALENENLSGKIVRFEHTFEDHIRDEKTDPAATAQKFFQSRGCIIMPYSFMYAHSGGKNEAWVEQGIHENGVRMARGIEQLTRSHLISLLEDPKVLEDRKNGKTLNPEWTRLRERVEMVNAERAKNEQTPLNVLFVGGGEGTSDGDPQTWSKSGRISKLLAKNFEFLGFKTDTIHLASEDKDIEMSSGNPNLTMTDVTKEGVSEDAAMQEAYRKLLQADMVIFSTPTRWFNWSARLQKFLERMTPLEASGFLLEGKAFGTIVTYGEGGGPENEKRLQYILSHQGFVSVPLGGIKVQTGMDLQESRGLPFKEVHGMAARSASLMVDYLAANGDRMTKPDFNGLRHPILQYVDPGD